MLFKRELVQTEYVCLCRGRAFVDEMKRTHVAALVAAALAGAGYTAPPKSGGPAGPG